MTDPAFNPRKPVPGRPLPPLPRPPSAKPKRVRGGIKIGADENPAQGNWAAQRWLRIPEQAALGPFLVEGLEYARLGQTRRFDFRPGLIEALVQGRMDRAYITVLRVQTFNETQWAQAVVRLAEGVSFAAKLLAGEMPPNIEEAFAPTLPALIPGELGDVKVSCTCADYVGAPSESKERFWCKHACCVAYLFAQRLNVNPLIMFGIRGLPSEDLLERLRVRRALASSTGGASPVYQQRVPGVSDIASEPLDAGLARFWEAGPSLRELDLPLGPPPVSHPLLRRLGPSPFQGAKFPLVGLLASCYETISEAARTPGPPPPPPVPEPEEPDSEAV